MIASRKRVAIFGTILVFAGLTTVSSHADEFPQGNVTIVTGSQGSTWDFLTRDIANALHHAWGKPVITEYRMGLSGLLAAKDVAQAKPDGHTLYHGIAGTILAYHTTQGDHINPAEDMVPVALAGLSGLVWVAKPDFPASTPQELIALDQANRGKVAYASYGAGSVANYYGEIFNRSAGTELLHIPYKTEAAALTNLLGGMVQIAIVTPAGAAPFIQDGKLKPIAVTGASRSVNLPDVPTFGELGFKGMDAYGWYGMFAPKGTPQPVLETISLRINEALASDAIQSKYRPRGVDIKPMSLSEFGEMARRDSAFWKDATENIKLN